MSRGCHCCCLVPACDRCNRRAAPGRSDRTRQDKRNHKRLLKGRTAEGEGKGREKREEGTTGATPRPSRSCHCSLSAKCRAQLWAGLIAATRQAREGEGHVDSLLIRMFPCLPQLRSTSRSDDDDDDDDVRRRQSPFSFSRALKQIFCS